MTDRRRGYFLSAGDADQLVRVGELIGFPFAAWLEDRTMNSFVHRLERESDLAARWADELDSTYRHIRAVIENCKDSSLEMIRHQLVGLLPEVQTFDEVTSERMIKSDMQHIVNRQEEVARLAWETYGYGQAAS